LQILRFGIHMAKRVTRSLLLWLITIILTLAAALYQRLTGPAYPVRSSAVVAGETIDYRLPRTHAGPGDAIISLDVADDLISGTLAFRRYKSNDTWQEVPMTRAGDQLTAALPHQPPAGKVTYRITLRHTESGAVPLTAEPVIIRFKGAVPLAFLIPHVILMFMAMLLSTRTGLEAVSRGPSLPILTIWTTGLLFLGGLILGPVVQKYAFGSFWTGWPLGHDLTDNKTAVAFIAWLVALVHVHRNPNARISPIVAALVLLVIYLIPHSVLGSELDYSAPSAVTSAVSRHGSHRNVQLPQIGAGLGATQLADGQVALKPVAMTDGDEARPAPT
jgi:hypothetical protein